VRHEQVRQNIDDIGAVETAIDADRQTFVCELVDEIEHSIFPPLMGAVLHEIVRPDVVGTFGAQPHARAVIEPQAASLGLFGRDLQPFASPDPFDTLVVHEPAGLSEQLGYLAITVTAILASQLDEVGGQPFFIITPAWDLTARVERYWPSTRHARRSETHNFRRTCSMHARRREGLSNFPLMLPGE